MGSTIRLERQGIPLRAITLAIASALGAMGAAQAMEFNTGNEDLSVRWDNTVKLNYAHRVNKQSPAIINTIGFDDGDRNFNRGPVSERVDVLSEFDLVYKKSMGFRVSGSGWYDAAYRSLDNDSVATSNHIGDGDKPALGLSNFTKRYFKGPSGELLDAFVFGSFELSGMPVNVKAGRHTVFWGEAVLNPLHSISYGQSSIDIGKQSAVPGTEAKELFRPRNQISAQLQATPELSFGAQYFFNWEGAHASEAGSYLGAQDYILNGGESLALTPGARLLRGNDIKPEKRGDYGFQSRWAPDWADATIGAYYRSTSDVLPQAIIAPSWNITGVFPAVPGGACTAIGGTQLPAAVVGPNRCFFNNGQGAASQILQGNMGRYYAAYADDIKVYGLSLSKNVAGVSVGGELSYRQNMPLVSSNAGLNGIFLLPSALAAAVPGSVSSLPGDGDVPGARGSTLHAVLNFFNTFANTPAFDSANMIVEFSWNRWNSVSQNADAFSGTNSYAGIDKPTKNFYGVNVSFTPVWFQVFPGVDLSAPISFAEGLKGNSAVLYGGNMHSGSYSAGVGADFYQRHRFDLKYIDYFGPYETNSVGAITSFNGTGSLLKDRGMVSLTYKTTF